MKVLSIDINCDVGEGIGNEAALLPLISSCNIACGGHAGDRQTISEVVKLAKKHKVKIGAHPSYPDRLNFGRKAIEITNEALKKSIAEQLKRIQEIVQDEHSDLHHIKAHGALYNAIAKDKDLAVVFLEAIAPYKATSYLYVPYGTAICTIALDKGFKVKYEAFADRNYNPDLSLVSRSEQNAIISEPNKVLQHVLSMVKTNTVHTIKGTAEQMEANTICVHGDTDSALEILMYLSQELPKHKVQIIK